MRHALNTKTTVHFAGTSATTGTASIDTLGFGFAKIICFSASTGALATTSKLEQSDDNSTWEAIPGMVTGTDWTPNTATNATTSPKVVFGLNTRGRKRYLKVTFEHATAGIGRIISELSEPADGEETASDSNVANLVIA